MLDDVVLIDSASILARSPTRGARRLKAGGGAGVSRQS